MGDGEEMGCSRRRGCGWVAFWGLWLLGGLLAVGCGGGDDSGGADAAWPDGAVPEQCRDQADNDGDGLVDCGDPDCRLDGACTGRVEQDCGDGADDDGDGLADCADPDCRLDSGCAAQTEQDCEDGADDDGDGLADCADPDCRLDGACAGQVEQVCGDGEDGDGDGLVDCRDPDCRLDPACIGQVERDCGDGEDDDGDGQADCADSDCRLDPGCTGQVEQDCGDGEDDDGDGLVDCADSDCRLDPGCAGQVEQDCGDGADNDGDGLADCADPDCGGSVRCEFPEGSCGDGFDNDGDGRTDCADSDCDGVGGCEAAEATCDDGVDNDADGLADCADPDCDGVGECEAAEATCDDGVDNDGDGQADCTDPDCDGAACAAFGKRCAAGMCTCPAGQAPEQTCGDGVDNDCNGLVDCGDPGCFGQPGCTSEQLCGDGQDNDGDGQADCADADCNGIGGCEQPEGSCTDGFDNDGDGQADCADLDCVSVPPCQASETLCDDGVDNDGDGQADCADAGCDGRACGPHDLLCSGGQCVCSHGSGTEASCGDGIDNDCNGQTDCADAACSTTLFCTRSGETCATAQVLASADTVLGDTTGFGNDLDPGAAGCTGQSAAGADRVYALDVQAGQRLQVTLTPTGGWQASLYAITDCADLAASCLGGSDGDGPESLSLRLNASGTVFLVVDGRTASDAGAYTLEVRLAEAGDQCADAPVITQSVTVHSSTDAMLADYDPLTAPCVPQPQPGRDRVYRVDLTYGERLAATLTPSGWDGSLYLIADCSDVAGSCVDGRDDSGAGGVELLTHTCRVAAETLFLVVDSPTIGGGGAYDLDLDIVLAGNDDCSLPVLLPSGSASFNGDLGPMLDDYDPTVGWSCISGAAPGPDAVYQVDLAAGETLTAVLTPTGSVPWDGVLYVMNDGCADPSACVAGADSALAGGTESLSYTAAVNETVQLVVDAVSAGGTYTLDTTVSRLGDDCTDPIVLQGTGSIVGSTAGFGDDVDLGIGCGELGRSTPGPDAVHEISVPAGTWLAVSVEPAGWDAALGILRPTCDGGGSCVLAADEHADASPEQLFLRAETAQTLTIVVDSAQLGVAGDYTLLVDGRPPTLLLSEVLHQVAGPDDGYEWVEIFNAETAPVSLSGFSLGFGGPDYTTWLVDLSGTVGPGMCAAVGGPLSSALNASPSFVDAVNLGGTTLDLEDAEGGVADGVALFDRPAASVTPSTVPFSAVVYGSSNDNGLVDTTGQPAAVQVGAAPEGQSIALDLSTGFWSVRASPSPGVCQ